MTLKKLRNDSKSLFLLFNELQADSSVKDLKFVCDDKIVTSHQALFSWMSSFLRRFFLSKQVMEDSGKRKDEVTICLPGVSSLTLDYVIRIFSFGEVRIPNEKTSREIHELWGQLVIDKLEFGSLGMTPVESNTCQTEFIPEVIDLDDEDENFDTIEDTVVKVENNSVVNETNDDENIESELSKRTEIILDNSRKEDDHDTSENTKKYHSEEKTGFNVTDKRDKDISKDCERNTKSQQTVLENKGKTRKSKTENKILKIGNPTESLQSRIFTSSNVSRAVSTDLVKSVIKAPVAKNSEDKRNSSSCSELLKSFPHIKVLKHNMKETSSNGNSTEASSHPDNVKSPEKTFQQNSVDLSEPQKEKLTRDIEVENVDPKTLEEIEKSHVQAETDSPDDRPTEITAPIVIPGYDNVEIKDEGENTENTPFCLTQREIQEMREMLETEDSADMSASPFRNKRRNDDDPDYVVYSRTPSGESNKRRRSSRLNPSGDGEDRRFNRENVHHFKNNLADKPPANVENKLQNKPRAKRGLRVPQMNDLHQCVICGVSGLSLKDPTTLKDHYANCFYSENIFPSFLSPGKGQTKEDGRVVSELRCRVRGCLLNVKSGSKGLLTYRDYAIHMAKDHGFLEKVMEHDPRPEMREILEGLKKLSEYIPEIKRCRFDSCEEIFSGNSNRELKLHYATEHFRKYFPVSKETGLSPGFCLAETKCKCVLCEQTGKTIFLVAGLSETIRHLVITHDGLKTILEEHMREAPEFIKIFNDIY